LHKEIEYDQLLSGVYETIKDFYSRRFRLWCCSVEARSGGLLADNNRILMQQTITEKETITLDKQ
jgi:hypothetical protein